MFFFPNDPWLRIKHIYACIQPVTDDKRLYKYEGSNCSNNLFIFEMKTHLDFLLNIGTQCRPGQTPQNYLLTECSAKI